MKRSILAMIAILTFCGIGLIASSAMAADGPPGIDGPLANATVSFGQWEPPLDRLSANPGAGPGNVHELAPNVVTIKAGGAVNFVISGLHNVQVYDDGTLPEDIGINPPTLSGAGGGIINVATTEFTAVGIQITCPILSSATASKLSTSLVRGPIW